MFEFSILKELAPLRPDDPISNEKLTKTPEPLNIRPTNTNRVAAVNRLLQNNLPLGLGSTDPPKQIDRTNHLRESQQRLNGVKSQDNLLNPHHLSPPQQIHIQPNQSLERQGTPTVWGPHSVGYNKYTADLIAQYEHANRTTGQARGNQQEGRGGERKTVGHAVERQHHIVNRSLERQQVVNGYNEQAVARQQYIQQQSPPHRVVLQHRQQIHPIVTTQKFSAQQPQPVCSIPTQHTQSYPPQPHHNSPQHSTNLTASTSHPIHRPWLVFPQVHNVVSPQELRQELKHELRQELRQELRVEQTELSNPESDGYPKKLASLSRKIDEIVEINQSLENKIDTMRQALEQKETENVKMKKKIAELMDKLKGYKREAEGIEETNVHHRTRLEQQTAKIRATYAQSTAKLQNDLNEARGVSKALQNTVKNLQKQCRSKDKQIQKYKEFVAQMHNGFEQIRSRQ